MRSACARRRIFQLTLIPSWALCAFVATLISTNAKAWENTCSHPRITNNAINLLNPSLANNNFFLEFNAYETQLDFGAKDEDNPTLSVLNHFYDPKTIQPMHDAADSDNKAMFFASLYDASIPQTTALSRGEYWWNRAVSDYKFGAKTNSYTELGHALHLLSQDVAQPAHVHNDPHVPYFKFISWAFPSGLDGSNESPLEASAEIACVNNDQTLFPAGAVAGIPTSIPVVHTGHLELDIAEAAARLSYSASVFSGSDPFGSPVLSSGHITIGGYVAQVSPSSPLPGQAQSDCLGNSHYSISRINPEDLPLCSNPNFTYAGTYSSHFSNDWWNISNTDFSVWDPGVGSNEFYFHHYDQLFFDSSEQTTLNAQLQQSQLSLSADYSAALLKLFAQTVDAASATISVQLKDASGPIATSSYTADTIYVTVKSPPTLNASGIGFLALENVDGNGSITGIGNILSPPTIGTPLLNSLTHTFNGLTPGLYQIHAVDGLGNHAYSTFTAVTVPPVLGVVDGYGNIINSGGSTQNGWLNISATLSPPINAPIGSLVVFLDPNYVNPVAQASVGTASLGFTPQQNLWYWAQACDVAGNCVKSSFVLAPPGGPVPPGPGPGPGGPNQPPYPPQPLLPPCLNTSVASCFPQPGGPGWPIGPNPSDSKNLPHRVPGDPNSLQGPNGPVTPGQFMTYTVEFENVGDGNALGVYVKDVLDPSLDDTSLALSSMYSLVFSSGVPVSTMTANFPWSYDPQTRTVTVLTGNAGPNSGGSFVLQTKLKSSAPAGTVISNQALVYFPNAAQQITPTNTVLSAVPLPTQLSYVGTSSGVYLGTAGLAAQLVAGGSPAVAQLVNFQLVDVSTAANTNSAGIASAMAFLSTAAGNYNLGMNYGGDGFYYLPSAANANFTLAKRNPILGTPFAAARPTDTVHLSLTLTDDQQKSLLHQTDEPKTVFLEVMSGSGTYTSLASSLLSGTTLSFQFSMPQPLALSWPIRARFNGDSRYAPVISTGTLQLIDDIPPVVALASPRGGTIISNSGQVTVNYTVNDNADLAPSATAYLLALDGSQSQAVANGGSVPASSLNPGSWTVIVSALDWAGNISSATSGPFLVTSDVLPPRTSIVAGSPSFGTNPIFVSSQTGISFQSVDDRSTVGDGIGIGVTQTQYALDGGSWTVFTSPFVFVGEGQHHVSFYSTDQAGNRESPQTVLLSVDSTPPATHLLIDGVIASSSSIVLISTDAISFSTSDAGSGVAQTLYSLDGSTTQSVAVSTFSLAVGTHTLSFQSVDNIGNLEALNSLFALVRSSNTTPPTLSLIPISGSTLTTTAPMIAAVYIDTGSGINASSLHLSLDGVDVTTRSLVTISSATFVPPAALTQGTHTVTASVANNTGYVATSTSNFFLDSIPPQTSLQVDGLTASATNLVLISTDSLGFVAVDSGTGVFQTSYTLDASTTASVYRSTFSLSAGTHSVTYQSFDVAGNTETAKSVLITVYALDTTPPVLFLSPPNAGTVTTATPVVVATYSDAGRGVDAASVRIYLDGVNVTTQAVVTTSSATFTVSTALSQATHTVIAQVSDLAGNRTISMSTFLVDSIPPVTALLVDGLTASATSLILKSTDLIGFSATDSGTGVANVLYGLDGATETVFASTFSLPAGTHTLVYQSIDNAGNVESPHAVALRVNMYDITPPTLTLMPPNGSTVTATTPTISAVYFDTGTGVNVATLRLAIDGVDVTTRAIVNASSATYIPTASLSQGTHTIVALVSDFAGNAATSTSNFFLDSVPPQTSLLVDGVPTPATALTLISTDTIAFAATDAGTGVANTLFALDGATETVFVSTFSPSPGVHTLAYQSIDRAGNIEALHVVSLSVRVFDVTPPSLALTPTNGSTVTTTTYALYAIYADTGTGVNVATVRLRFDGIDVTTQAVVTTSSASFVQSTALSQGTHTVTAQVADFAGNQSSAASAFFVDSMPPVTTLLVDGLANSATNLVLLSTDSIGFIAFDAGSGVAQTRYALDGGLQQVFTLPFTLSVGTHTLAYQSVDKAGNVEILKTVSAGVRLYDVTPPALTLAPVNGSTITTTTPLIAAVYFDTGTGVNTATLRLAVDGVDVTTRAVVALSSASFTPPGLSQGGHTVSASVADYAGNVASASSNFFVDSLSPVTTLLVDGLATGSANLVLVTTDTIGFVAVDSGTGVAQTRYTIDGGLRQIYTLPFSLAVGSHTLAFQSIDNAGNLEALKSVFVAVPSTGSVLTPPMAVILSPEGSGYCVVIKGVVPILGTVVGQGLTLWRLEFAPGQSAVSGFVFIASGTAAVAAGTLASWNTSGILGWETLRLTALNSASQSASTQLNVYAGHPSLLLAITQGLGRPSGVAVSQSGYIYVADTNNDRVSVFNSMGGLLSSFGADRGDGHKNLVALNKPQGVAVDVFGNIYVADTKDNRAVKLSSMGQLIFEIPKLGRPQGIALDSAGNIYVSDTDNGQVKKFSIGGALMQTFALAGSKPAGLAVDGSNLLYVADPRMHRVAVFAPSGALLKTLGPGLDLDRPTGVAVSPSGGCLIISDARGDKLFKLDARGEPTSIFGGGDSGLRGPRGLAFDAAGELYVADSGRDRVIKLGPPLPGMPSVPLGSLANRSGEVTAIVTAKDGGRLLGWGRAALFVPPAAVTDDLEITLSTPVVRLPQEEALKARKLDAAGLISVSTGVQCGPEGTTFLTPSTVVVPYDLAAAQAAGIPELGLQVFAWDPDHQQWTWLSSAVDPKYHTVTAKTTHLSHFIVTGKKPQN